jgi:hypothetical protein
LKLRSLLLGLVCALVGTAGAFAQGEGGGDAAAAGNTRLRLLLLPVVVHSAEDRDYIREGLADMLSARIERAGHFELMRLDDEGAATTQLPKALRQARERDADFVLFGSFTRFGQGASLDMQCAAARPDASPEPLREIFVHSGSIGDVIPDLDTLVGKVSRFAVEDFEAHVAALAEGDGDAPALTPLEELRRRVAELEANVRRLREMADADGQPPNVGTAPAETELQSARSEPPLR